MILRLLATALLLCAGLWAQDRDFLTPNEVDQVRQAQEPNARLALYIEFAKTRIDLLQQYVAKAKPGRSLFIHNTLEDYNKIIEAIDMVSDDALRRKVDISEGLATVADAEKQFLTALNHIKDSDPSDLERYRFVLTQAIDTTSDSHELAMEDTKNRGQVLSAEDAKQKAEREALMSQSEVKDRKKTADAEAKEKKKVPSLFKPGEKKPDSR